MKPQHRMLLESISGHLALLGKVNPQKASSPLARKTGRYVRQALRPGTDRLRRAAA